MWNRRLLVSARALALVLAVFAVFAAADASADDPVPAGAVAFFSTASCPSGWAPFEDGAGRLILATSDGSKVLVKVGRPLANMEDRTHKHAYTTQVDVDDKSISASHCCNNKAAEAKKYDVKGNTGEATTGLPFIQLVICEKQ